MLSLLYGLAVVLYILALLVARRSLSLSGNTNASAGAPSFSKLGLLVLGCAVLAHILTVVAAFSGSGPPKFGFALALSIMLCGGAGLLWAESFSVKIEPLWILILPFAAIAAALPAFFPGVSLSAQSSRPLFIPHLVVGMLAYSFLALAAVHAVLMILAERSLHRPMVPNINNAATGLGGVAHGSLLWLERLPPLLVLEKILFRILLTGFVLLTLTVLSGVVFSEEVFGQPWRLDHKSVFSVIAWTVFAVLLAGRSLWGWRGRMAARITLGGFALLMLAYVGSRFVIEVVLGRN
jgi:ABC-type uncharacterized transport system permease subunit